MAVRIRTALTLAALAGALLLSLPGAGRAGTPAEDLAWLNAKRAASGIPAGIVENPEWSAACAQHLEYMRRTGQITHAEDPASPYYTEAGNWAGTHAVLASAATWTASDFIWETAPLHLVQLLAPQLSEVGIADDGQFVCVTTWPGYQRAAPATDSIVAYPGPDVPIYASETAEEWPTTPGAALGLGTPTGPHIYAYLWGPSTAAGVDAAGAPLGVRSATVEGPDGSVPVRWVDPRNATVGRYLPAASAIIIPVQPLRRDASYIATVTFTNGVARAWTFTTAATLPAYVVRNVHVVITRTGRQRVCVRGPAADCERWVLRYTAGLRINGRVLLRGTPEVGAANTPVRIAIDRVERPLARTAPDGRFQQRTFLRQRRAKVTLLLTVTAADSATAAYLVNVDLSKPGRRVMRSAEVLPLRPPPRSAGQASAPVPAPT